MSIVVGREVSRERPYNLDFYGSELYIWQWLQFVQKSQLLLAERRKRRKAETHKTVPCQAWEDTGRCNYGKRCKFAHGPEELRPMPNPEVKVFNNPRYRTAMCVKYTTYGYCPYGDQCHFIHDPVQIDLEKCLEWFSEFSPSSQLPSEQGNGYLHNASSAGVKSAVNSLEDWRKGSRFEVTSALECTQTKSGSCCESESVSSTESAPENVVAGTKRHDPFRGDRSRNSEIELKPLQFNVFNDFLDVINPQSVLPEKQ